MIQAPLSSSLPPAHEQINDKEPLKIGLLKRKALTLKVLSSSVLYSSAAPSKNIKRMRTKPKARPLR